MIDASGVRRTHHSRSAHRALEFVFGLCLLALAPAIATGASSEDALADAAKGLKLRSIGPAFMGGRIADIAIHPDHRSL